VVFDKELIAMPISQDYFEQSRVSNIEKLILASPVKATSPIDTKGQFYLPSFNPIDTLANRSKPVYNKATTQTNYVELLIPGYMLLAFMKPSIKQATIAKLGKVNLVTVAANQVIPKGTEFLGEYIGGERKLEALRIVGIVPTKTDTLF
jgi:hypothetical protein